MKSVKCEVRSANAGTGSRVLECTNISPLLGFHSRKPSERRREPGGTSRFLGSLIRLPELFNRGRGEPPRAPRRPR